MNRAKEAVLLTAWILLILALLASCGSEIKGDKSTDGESLAPVTSAVTESGSAAETTAGKEHLNSGTISKYTIIYSSGNSDSAACADMLKKRIHEGAGVDIVTSGGSATDAEFRIIIGDAASAKEAALGYDDFRIMATGSSILIDGGSKYALFNAADRLFKDITCDTPCEELNYTYKSPSRDEYINDCTGLIMHWNYELTCADWMIPWDGKLSRLCDTSDTHVFTISHRGDFTYYPENSLESYISVYKMGGDAVEIDVQVTSDGDLVLMHDATLTRMTDYLNYAGKTVGGVKFPDSANIRDWTLEQLSYLRLKDGEGGDTAAMTPYRIPTLEEVLTFTKNRLFIVLDKPENWRYAMIDGIMAGSAANYIYPLMEKTKNYTSVLISYGTTSTDAAKTLNADQAIQIQEYIMDKSGEKCYMYLRGWTTRGTAAPYAGTLEKKSLTNSAILVNGEFDPGSAEKIYAIKALATQYKNTKLGGWTLTVATDNAAVWGKMYDTGIRIIMSNDIVSLIKYASEIK